MKNSARAKEKLSEKKDFEGYYKKQISNFPLPPLEELIFACG